MAPSTIDACEYWSSRIVSPDRISAEMKPTLALYPVGKTMQASLSLNRASSETNSSWTSKVPERIGEPEAPRPYFSMASVAAFFTSGRYEMPR